MVVYELKLQYDSHFPCIDWTNIVFKALTGEMFQRNTNIALHFTLFLPKVAQVTDLQD